MGEVISRTCKTMKDMSNDEYFAIKEMLISPSWKYSHTIDLEYDHEPEPLVIDEMKFHITGVAILIVTHLHYLPCIPLYYRCASLCQ